MNPRRPLVPEDLLRMRWVSEPQIRPGRDEVTCVITSIRAEAWDYQSHLMEAGGGRVVPLTGGPWLDRSPRWAPDGTRLAFVSNRSGAPQVWLREASGALRQVSDLPHGVSGAPIWTPDGQALVVSAPQTVGSPAGRPGEPAPTLRVIRTLDYRADPTAVAHGARGHLRGFRNGQRQQIWWMPAAGGPARLLTSGDFEHLRPSLSPDGRWVGFVANRTPDADRTTGKHLWVVPVTGGEPRRVAGGWGPITDIAWAPDGTRLAFTGHLLGDAGQDRTMPGLFAVDLDGGKPLNLLEGFAPTLGVWARGDFRMGDTLPALVWTERGLYFIASWRGCAGVYRVGPGGVEAVLGGERSVFAFTAAPDGRVAFVAETPLQPGDLYCLDEVTGREERLTDVNTEVLSTVALSAPEPFPSPGVRGQDVDAWIMRPVGLEPGHRYPLVLETHRGAYGQGFFFQLQVLAGAGYAVAYCNHVGAQGYGQAYALGQDADWGGADVQEMLRCLEVIGERFDFVDMARLGVQGLSAGGFYTNWLLGETDRFKAGVSEAGIWNWTSMFGTSDIGFPYVTSEMDGPPWEAFERYWRMSPLSRAHRIRTPMLIIHADEDYRCPISEGEQLFQALRYLGRPVEFLWFVGETHGFSRTGRPVNRIERLRRIVAWFDAHLQGRRGDAGTPA